MPVRVLSNKMADVGLAARDFMNNKSKCHSESCACEDNSFMAGKDSNMLNKPYPTQPSEPSQQPHNQFVTQPPFVKPDYSQFDLVKATQYGIIDRCKELIEKEGVDVRTPDRENVTPLHWASINNRKELVEYFLSKGALVNQSGGILQASPLHWAIRQGHMEMVVLLLKHEADPTTLDVEGCNCLHVAAQHGHTGIVSYLIAKGMDVDIRDKNGMTALMWAAYRTFGIELTRLLLSMNASVNVSDFQHKNTALHWAVASNNRNVIRMLCQAGAALDFTNSQGQTPLDIAVQKKNKWIQIQLNQVARDKGKGKPAFLHSVIKDKMCRRYILMGIPFFVLFAIGTILEFSTTWVTTLLPLLFVGSVVWFLSSMFILHLENESLVTFGVTLGSKAFLYFNIFAFLWPHVSTVKCLIPFVVNTAGLFWCFKKAWKADPGIIRSTPQQRKKAVIELAEQNMLDFGRFCSTCLVRRPVRSKHCSACDKCVARMDHHCPWIENCVGVGNHHYFIGFLFFLFLMIQWYLYGSVVYLMETCDGYTGGWWDAVTRSCHCAPWVSWGMGNALFHFMWVGALFVCQCYQVFWLGMTTNERINMHRYTHFTSTTGEQVNPFSRSVVGNIADFFGVSILNVKPVIVDWYKSYDLYTSPHETV